MGDEAYKSGVHLTGEDSGWPVAADAEPPHHKDGTGADSLPKATAVVDGAVTDVGVDEVQVVTITGAPTGGTFTLTYSGQTTDTINYNAAAATVKSKLEALSNIDEVGVTGSAGGPYTVTFKGDLADKNVAQMTADATLLTGGTAPAVTVTTETAGEPL